MALELLVEFREIAKGKGADERCLLLHNISKAKRFYMCVGKKKNTPSHLNGSSSTWLSW